MLAHRDCIDTGNWKKTVSRVFFHGVIVLVEAVLCEAIVYIRKSIIKRGD